MLHQVINIQTMCPNYILEFRNMWAKIGTVIENHVC